MRDNQDKLNTVITKNTFYFCNRESEESYEGYINSVKETLLALRNEINSNGFNKSLFETLLYKKENGLRALLALTGFSNESLKRLITFVRVVNDPELNTLIMKDKWTKRETYVNNGNIKEWSDDTIQRKIKEDSYFRKGLVNIFYEGATVPVLSRFLPLFELKKLSTMKLNFNIDALIDTIVRYKEKGSYSGKKVNNPELVIEDIIDKLKLSYETGDLTELISNAPNTKRTMDFIIPNKTTPKLIIECSYLVTTSSGQGDKSKTEISIDSLIKEHYPEAHFWGFIDGIGWYVRKGDLARMITAYEDVFTFHQDELTRFSHQVKAVFGL